MLFSVVISMAAVASAAVVPDKAPHVKRQSLADLGLGRIDTHCKNVTFPDVLHVTGNCDPANPESTTTVEVAPYIKVVDGVLDWALSRLPKESRSFPGDCNSCSAARKVKAVQNLNLLCFCPFTTPHAKPAQWSGADLAEMLFVRKGKFVWHQDVRPDLPPPPAEVVSALP